MFENENEHWKGIPNYPDYMISDLGRLYSNRKDKFISCDEHGNVTLYNSEGHKGWSIQVLMGCLFLGNDIDDPFRNRTLFKDGDSSNLVLSNIYIEDTSDISGEVWMPLTEATGRTLKNFYKVSNMGRIKSIRHYVEGTYRGRMVRKPCPELIISTSSDFDGYQFAYLACEDGSSVNAQVHRLVAAAFCHNPDPETKTVVNHIDGDPSNNRWTNLEWCTPKENSQHAINTGLRGDWKGRRLRYPVRRTETNQLYNSISEVERAMGRPSGYCSDALHEGRGVTDIDGNVWTLEIFKDMPIKVHSAGQQCTIDEFPGRVFVSLSEASLAIGRWEGYISDALSRGGVIRNKAGNDVHIHLAGDAPIVCANDIWKEKKKAGLVPDKKERKRSNWAPRKSVRCVETGEIFASFSDADTFLGRKPGYLSDCFAYCRECFDRQGNKYTFEVLNELVKVHRSNNPCCFEEYPENKFSNLSEASLFIGRCSSYVNDRFKQGKPILTLDGREIHLKLLQK